MCWIIVLSLLLSVLFLFPGSVITTNEQIQTADAIRTIKGGDKGQCPSMEKRERVRNELCQFVASVIANTTSAPTMSTVSGCSGLGWRRVAFINMTDTSYNCPNGLRLTSHFRRTCGKSLLNGGCSSTTFSVGGLPYSQVCGRIRGYQYGSTSAFGHSTQDIESRYVDGVALTHGTAGSRQHIWTFAAGLTEVSRSIPNEGCPCDTSLYNHIPIFVGNDYFCESGLHSSWDSRYYTVFHANDTLWDGQGCMSNSTCCQFNNPPWFTKNLPTATTDDIELRICASNRLEQEDVPLELIELYVQ